MLPRWETPEHTEGYEGFYHLVGIEGSVEETVLTYIIRDHDHERFESRKREIEHLVRKTNIEFLGCASVEIKDQYYNMREKIEPVMHIIEVAEKAMLEAGVDFQGATNQRRHRWRPAFIQEPALPEYFAGGENFHGRYEYVSIQSMEKAASVIVNICRLVAEK